MRTFLLFSTLLVLSGCKAVDAKLAKDFTSRDLVLMQQLAAYLDADEKAGKKTPDQVASEKAGIGAHLSALQKSVSAIPATEEASLMAELLAYVQADPKRDADSKQYKADRIQAHLKLYNDLK